MFYNPTFIPSDLKIHSFPRYNSEATAAPGYRVIR